MQTTLAASAAAREEQRVKRASQEGYAASTTDAVDALMKGKKEPENLRATYHEDDNADAYFAEQQSGLCADGDDGYAPTRPQENRLVVAQDGAGDLMMPFSGFYDEVNYPVTTLFYPPHAPSEMPPRVQMPPRPGPVYKNDLALCGDRENDAQLMVSKIWRGIMTRRNLQSNRAYEHILNYRARMIQSWWRTVVSHRRHEQLAGLKGQWVEKRAAEYMAERQKGLANMMTWQRRRFEGAAIVIQRVVRWHLSRCARQRAREEGLPEAQWPAERPFPIEHKVTRYFPWRRSTVGSASATAAAAAGAAANETGAGHVADEEPRRRTILEFKKERDPVQPPQQQAVEKDNDAMRRRTRERARSLAAPEVQSRREWKQEGLRKEDLDFNAGVIQRLFRAKRSSSKVRTVELSKAYMDKTVRIIARTFRMYILVQHLKTYRHGIQRKVRSRLDRYSKDKIAEIEHKVVWGKELLDASARTIQQCWHWYRFQRFNILPLRIRQEMERRDALAREKADLEEARRVEREETIRRLQEELGVPAEALSAEPEENLTEEERQQQDEERRRARDEADRLQEERRRAEDEQFAELNEPFVYDEPAAPPYRLIDDYLAREEELRDAMLNLLERNEKQMVKSHKYTTFTPEKTIVRKNVNTFIPKAAS